MPKSTRSSHGGGATDIAYFRQTDRQTDKIDRPNRQTDGREVAAAADRPLFPLPPISFTFLYLCVSWSVFLAQDPVGDAAHTVTLSMSHAGEGGNVVDKYLEGHTTLPAGGSGYKSLLVLDGKAEAYIHVTAIKVKGRGRGRERDMPAGYEYTSWHFPSGISLVRSFFVYVYPASCQVAVE